VKEIHSHLNLQPPRSPITSEGEESPKIESFEERIACFDVETSMQQWYGDTSFNGFVFDYVVRPVHPHLTLLPLTPLLRLMLMMMKMKRVEKKKMTMSEAS
jgi:hypothetical protein